MAAASMQVEGDFIAEDDIDKESGWKKVTSRRKKKVSREQHDSHASEEKVSARRPFSSVVNRVVKASRMPPMPQEHIKIVIRPRGGLNLEKVGPTVGKAITEAASLSSEQTLHDVICPNITQNIMVASTPLRENADKYARIKFITVAGKVFEVNAYETAPSDTCKGIIRNVDIADGPATLERNILNDRNPLALGVKRIKNSGSVIIVFDGLRVPNFVRYGPTLVRCYLYRKQVDVCYACGKIGHRKDVCPTPGVSECRGCGVRNPSDPHVCNPKCKLCGGLHVTADKSCKKRYLMPYVVRVRRQERAKAQMVKEETQTVSDRSESRGRASSRCRSRSRRRASSKKRDASRSRGRSRSRGPQARFAAGGGADSWANKVKGKEKGADQPMTQANRSLERDRILSLEKENNSLRAVVERLTLELIELRREITRNKSESSESPSDSGVPGSMEVAPSEGERPSDSEVPRSMEVAPSVGEVAECPAPKKRALTPPTRDAMLEARNGERRDFARDGCA
ncbi:uncharacterized protein LOC144168379 [Haemaphysalis longicornis]